MGEAVWWLIVGSLLVRSEPALAWGSSCPVECSCHLSYFADLPLNHWLESNKEKKITVSNNEAYYEDDDFNSRAGLSGEQNDLLKMAMCIFQTGVSPSTLLDQLPVDTQVLSLLQGKNTGEIILEPENMQGFHYLIYLDVQGYSYEANQEILDNQHEINNNSLILSHDIFKSLSSLQYLNLQNIKLQNPSEKDNKIRSIFIPTTNTDPISNEIPITLPGSNLRKKNKDHPDQAKLQNLIFLTPAGSENEVVPYKTYLEKKEDSGPSTFAGLSNLKFLRVYSCDLHNINWEMFDGLHTLRYLSLEKNHLLFIPDFAFYGTPNLKTLSLSHNKLLNLQSTSLAGLLKLEELDLSHNKFSHLSEFSLPPFPKLQTANFKHNPIEAIFASTFEIMNATKALYLGGNSSTLDVHPNSFLGLHSLRKLSIDNVSIDLLERQLLSGMPELTELEIYGTIKALSFDAFIEVSKLEKIFLQGCKIESISMDAFYGLYGLLVLDLSKNMLQILPPGLFDQQFSLKELYLQGNLLKELPVGFFKNLPVELVRLEGNPWHCSCGMKDWPPSVINKVKQRKINLCQREYDKGSGCSSSHEDVYMYDKKVTPHCTTPNKYKGLGVFQVLRKELRCTKKLKNKLNRNFYLRKKYEDYEKLVKTGYYDKARTGYLEEIQNISNSRNKSIIPLKNTTIVNELRGVMNKQLAESHSIKPEFTTTYHPEKMSPKYNNPNNQTSVPLTDANHVNITSEKNHIIHNDTITLNLESQEPNELSPVDGKNILTGYEDLGMPHKANKPEASSIKLEAEGPIHQHTKMHDHESTVPGRSSTEISKKENVNPNEAPDKEEAKALKKIWKLEMERNRQKKLQKYYS
ncbi:insulin-like growth factor-binding protein complex acid labile subunit [Anabrus simplex]|uniref:insulin-like growth factor-binding protein complex acid labile subunit n=1 Tax=Anabrus simplex TaxID=316456 RepID=UPI0035A340A4